MRNRHPLANIETQSWELFVTLLLVGVVTSSVFWLLPWMLPDQAWAANALPDVPAQRETAQLTYAPEVPPPIERNYPVIVEVHIEASKQIMSLDGDNYYEFWTFNKHVPGPFIRARVGDTLEIHFTNNDTTGMRHTIDFHAATGPGGGAGALTAGSGETKIIRAKLMYPGLFVYHCAVPPVPDHIANGMYGLVLVEPAGGLDKVDREFYLMQSEFYTSDPEDAKKLENPGVGAENAKLLEYVREDGVDENPRYIVFNGKVGSLIDEPLQAETDDRVRFYFGNIGPNLVSSFHVIGAIFDKVYREAGLIGPASRGIQSTMVPAGGATIVEFDVKVPGNFILVDHAIFRIEKGAAGILSVTGDPRPDIFESVK